MTGTPSLASLKPQAWRSMPQAHNKKTTSPPPLPNGYNLNAVAKRPSASVDVMWPQRSARSRGSHGGASPVGTSNCRLNGRIHFNDGRKSKSLPCTIRDISYEGARIELSDATDIPDAIDLYIPQKHRILHASVRWRHGNRVGVAFTSVLLSLTAPPTSYAVLGGSISIVP